MYYIVRRQSPAYHQLTLDEFLFKDIPDTRLVVQNITGTRTDAVESISPEMKRKVNPAVLTAKLKRFNDQTEGLRGTDRRSLYHSFRVPKKRGGTRKIDAPQPELMNALRVLKTIFEQDFHALYHTSAFAYVKGRSTLDTMKRHQQNHSRWFAKLDLHNFFGSTTKEFVVNMFAKIYPFCEVIKTEEGRAEFEKAIDLAFLDGVLPQGTPISPLITNVMMIPVDYDLSNAFRKFNGNKFVYTRYADDFTISCAYDFSVREVEDFVLSVLAKYNAPFSLNREKTRYGSSSGSNWNLGLMLNKDNELTVGYKNKKQFRSILYNYAMDYKSGIRWDPSDIQSVLGKYSYYRMVEGDKIDHIVSWVQEKTSINSIRFMRAELAQ